MEDMLLKVITSGGGATSAIIVYLMFTIKKDVARIAESVAALHTQQKVLEEKLYSVAKRLSAQESKCNFIQRDKLEKSV